MFTNKRNMVENLLCVLACCFVAVIDFIVSMNGNR